MNINFKRIDKNDKYYFDYYNLATIWDKKHVCFNKERDDYDLFGIFELTYLMYLDDYIIGYANIFLAPSIGEKKSKAYLSYVIRPEYRKKGYGKIFVDELVNISKNELKIDEICVEILKKNIPSISLIEKMNFDFDHFDDRKIVFKKKLK